MKKVFYYVLLLPVMLVVVATLFTSCTGNKAEAKSLNGKWEIVSVNDEQIKSEEMPFIEFDMETLKVHGNAGCNFFNSSCTLSDSDAASIVIAPAASTMMACPNLETEGKILKALLDVTAVKGGQNAGEMTLVDKDGNVLLVLNEILK